MIETSANISKQKFDLSIDRTVHSHYHLIRSTVTPKNLLKFVEQLRFNWTRKKSRTSNKNCTKIVYWCTKFNYRLQENDSVCLFVLFDWFVKLNCVFEHLDEHLCDSNLFVNLSDVRMHLMQRKFNNHLIFLKHDKCTFKHRE